MDINIGCLDEKILSSYLDEKLSDTERKKIEEHIAGCNICLDMLLVAYEAQKNRFSTRPPRGLTRTILATTILLERKNRVNQAGSADKTKKKRRELKWLFAGLVSFALSFIFKHYFLQFLAVSVILGFKWVMEGEAAKRVIMIFKGIQEQDSELHKDDASRIKKF